MLGGIEFLFVAMGITMVVRAVRGDGRRRYRDLGPPPPPTMLEDPRVSQLQAEVDELRAQVERLSEAESFYAQLNAPAPPRSSPPPSIPPPPGSSSGGGSPGGIAPGG
ncbi:MAG TPA: hypothetical protein VF771_17365 [Longimicrobiaceae bacterium]